MKSLVIGAGLLALIAGTQAETLKCCGVLGNSGEQGATLVRFGEKPASGLGVVYDKFGSLWDRAGDGVLNRYSADGRLFASYRIASSAGRSAGDKAVLMGDMLLLKVGKKLYTLPVDAAPESAPTPLKVEVTRLSFGTRDGWAAAAREKEVFLINATGTTRAVATLDAEPDNIEIGPDGGVFVQVKGKLLRVDATDRSPLPSPGGRPQWLTGHWFGGAWHGTIRRFNAALQPDPGVVLGGASGSFIGYVEGNHELNNPCGLAHLGANLYAASGWEGILHLLEWQPADKRFKIIRRIGAVPQCSGLAMDRKGRVWHHTGVWEWNDGPDAPLKHSVPPPEEMFGAVMLENDVMVAPANRWGKKALYHGKLDGPVAAQIDVNALPLDGVACAAVTWEKRQALLVVTKTGKGAALAIGQDGKFQNKSGPVELQAATPLRELTSLASSGTGTLLAAADGQIIEFKNWQETRRWRSWDDDRFGDKIFLAASQGRLWVSDTTRHRVVCFDLAAHKPRAVFGTLGNELAALQAPQIIAANGSRAVVFDSGNQRLVKLELPTP